MPPSPFHFGHDLKTEKRFKHISESTGRMDHQSFQEYNARSRSLMLASTTYYLAEVVLLAGLVCMGTQEKKEERKEARRPSSRATAMEATAAASTHAASERRLLAAVMIACRESEPFSPPPVRHARVGPLTRMIARVGHTDA